MPKISSYVINTTPEATDILIGTDVTNGQTKNFNIQSLSDVSINSFLKLISWEFISEDPDPDPRPQGTISFQNYGGGGASWSSISSIYINTRMPGNPVVSLPYLQRLVGRNIVIQDKKALARYGVYKLTTLSQVDTDVYEMALTHITGNATLQALKYYSIQIDEVENGDKHFEFTQGVPSTLWQIQHNLDKLPSVTAVNINDVQVFGEVEYVDKNNLNVHFTAGFSGKAYLN